MIISLVAILVLCDGTKGENEIQWFFPTGDLNTHENNAQFLGWKMGSSLARTECKSNDRSNGTSRRPTTEANVKKKVAKCTCFPLLSELKMANGPVKTMQTWKTIVVDDSTIHYIPLEDMATAKAALFPFIMAEDALDPYFDFYPSLPIERAKPVQLLSQQHLQPNLQQFKNNAMQPLRRPPQKPMDSFVHYPAFRSDSYYKNVKTPLQSIVKPVPFSMFKNEKLKTGMPKEPRHTMFVHPNLLGMMKAIDRSILSFPSPFDYKSTDQFPGGAKRLLYKRHNKSFEK